MKKIYTILLTTVAAASLAVDVIASSGPAFGAAPVTLTFEKCLADSNTGLFTGRVAGECGDGSVIYETIVLEPNRVGVRIEGLYRIVTATHAFVAHCSGHANTHNGEIVLNGEVLEGSADFAGARVQVRAQLLTGGLCSAGTITLSPRK